MASRQQSSRERGRADSLIDRGDWGKRSMFFETEPHRWGFQHAAGFRPSEPLAADPGSRARPKLGSFDAARPGLFAPRPFQREPFQRERRSSDGTSCNSEEDRHSQASSSGSCGEPEARPPPAQASSVPRERIIPIRIEGDGDEESPMDPPPQRPARKHERRDTVDGASVETPQEGRDGEARDTRAQSCPVTSPLANATGAGSSNRFAPLKVNEALASQQREAGGRPSYQNMSPKPFSPGARPFKSSSFGMFGSPTRSEPPPAPRPPPVPPKPSPAEIRAARHQTPQKQTFTPQQQSQQQEHHHPQQQSHYQPQQQNHQQQQQNHHQQQQKDHQQQHHHQQQQQNHNLQHQQNQPPSEQQSQQQPMSAKDAALSKIATIHTDLDPLTRRLESFAGAKGDKEYLFLDEMLTRCLIKLDGLETGGDADVRSARKEAVRRIEGSLSTLERRSAMGAKNAPKAATGDSLKSAGMVMVNGVKIGGAVSEADRRAASAPPQGLARAEPVVIGGEAAEEAALKRRVSAEEMGRR